MGVVVVEEGWEEEEEGMSPSIMHADAQKENLFEIISSG
jgi:hypothetical protein